LQPRSARFDYFNRERDIPGSVEAAEGASGATLWHDSESYFDPRSWSRRFLGTAASFKEAALPHRDGFVMSSAVKKELALYLARVLTEPSRELGIYY
jgi:hypothetical protein